MPNNNFKIVISGVGGQGLITLLKVITQAALNQGLEVRSSELHGLSQRGGNVEAHVIIGKKVYSPLVSLGQADLIISLEMSEALRVNHYAKEDTVFVVNRHYIFYQEALKEKDLIEKLNNFAFLVPASEICHHELENEVLSTIYLLGFAVFKKLIPLKKESVEQALKDVIPEKYLEQNLKAFNLAKENNIEKVVVAAAGKGTRMLHMTKNKPKHLINVKKKPFLTYLFDNLFMAGYSEIILIVGHKAEQIEEFVKNYKPPKYIKKYKINVLNQYKIVGEQKYGTACPLETAKDLVKNDHFLFVCGDNLYSAKSLQTMNIKGDYHYIAGLFHDNPQKYGVLITDNGTLKEIKEKPKENLGNFINSGLYKFTPEVFEKLSLIKKSERGEYEITDIINLLAKEGKVKVKKINDSWLDFGNPADVMRASRFLGFFKKWKRL
ncbi:MAG: sugar phosphate nucleotidyltransferase [Candidatus Pacebacteria bacterium]|nr:sugar phosphate nucleotidyltransferase [Candidatus Paceibacterota bacterium]